MPSSLAIVLAAHRPFKRGRTPSARQRTSLFKAPKGPMATVLLVEPHAESARAYAQSLERAGFRVETSTAGGQDLNLAPDVVVIGVPRLQRSLLRVLACGLPVPRIVLSSEAADAERAAEFECAAVLIRPVMYDDLVREVRRVLKATGAAQPA